MTIQFPTNYSTATPAADTETMHVRHSGAATAQSLDPANWRDVPPPGTNSSSKSGAAVHGRMPIAPPPAGETHAATTQSLLDKFNALLHGSQNQDSGSGSNDSSNDGTKVPPPAHHFSLDDFEQIMARQGLENVKSLSAQTQDDLQQRITVLGGEVDDIRSAGHDRMVGSILSGVGMMAQGVASMGAAGVSGYGIYNANLALESGPSINPQTEAQMFTKLTANSSSWSQGIGGFGNATQGGFSIGQGQEESKASRQDADKAEDDKEVTELEALHDNAQNMKQQLQSVVQDYIDKRKSMEQQQDETMRAIARA